MPNAANFAAVARSNNYLRRALEEFPDFMRAVELHDAVTLAQRELPGVGTVPSPAEADGLDDFLDAVGRNAVDRFTFEAKRGALMSLRGETNGRIGSVVSTHSEAILESLAEDFDKDHERRSRCRPGTQRRPHSR